MSVSRPAGPFSHILKVETLRQRETAIVVAPDAAARARIAAALDLASVEALEGRLTLARNGERVRLVGRVVAALHQSCIVTLEPFPAAIDTAVTLDFVPEAAIAAAAARSASDRGDDGAIDVEIGLEEDDPPEPIVDGAIDLGAVLCEFLALSLDPYPRKPGVAFAAPEADAAPLSPFATLAQLKRDD